MRWISPFAAVLFAAALWAAGTEWIGRLGGQVERDDAGNVTAVNLAGRWVNDTEMLELAELPRLERLDLSHTRISDEGLLRLKRASHIQDLNLLYAEQITDLGLGAIKEWKNLKRLNLRGTRISDATLELVGKLPQLEWLDVAATPITDNGVDHLVSLTRLKHLAIGSTRVNYKALVFLRLLSTLESLDLGGPRGVFRAERQESGIAMPDALIAAIAELKQLRVLRLGHTLTGTNELKRLAGALPHVERLGLEACPRVGDDTLQTLAGWKSLRYLDVQETKATPGGIAGLKTARPDLAVLSTPPPGS